MIIRTKKTKNYTTISNVALKDKKLSWKAKGLFAYMMTNIDEWEFHVSELENHSTDGISATRSAVNELIDEGYLNRDIIREEGKIAEHSYTLYETPQPELIEKAKKNKVKKEMFKKLKEIQLNGFEHEGNEMVIKTNINKMDTGRLENVHTI